LNKQSTLDPFFDLSAGALANYAPRKRSTANVSKRLLSVIKQFREAEARAAGIPTEAVEWGAMMQGLDEEDPKGRGTGKKRSVKAISEIGDGEDSVKGKKQEVKKRKTRAPRSKKAVSVATSDAETDYGLSEDGSAAPAPAPLPAQKPRKPRAKKAAHVPPELDNGLDEEAGAGGSEEKKKTSEVPVEGRKKWRREQQKTWRRAAVANSLKPN
jgi:DNA excision repair protein ERCC-5